MRVAIVDDVEWMVERMSDLARQAGHTVLGVHIGIERNNDDGLLHILDLYEAAKQINVFGPDIIILDHQIKSDDENGRFLAKIGSFPKERCVGSSSTPQFEYCFSCLQFNKGYLMEEKIAKNFVDSLQILEGIVAAL